jgi:hypothetical protein
MPQDGLFFRVLRRFNMILVTVIGLVIIAGAGVAAWNYFVHILPMQEQFRSGFITEPKAAVPAAPTDIVVSDDYATPNADYNPGGYIQVLRRVPGSAQVIRSFSSTDPYGVAAPSYPGVEDVNIMVVDPKSGKGHWLFEGTKRNIVMREAIYEGANKVKTVSQTDTRPLIGLVFWVVETDTDKDGALTASDAITLCLWLKGETRVTKLMQVDYLLSTSQITADRWLVTYRKGKELHTALYSVPEFQLVADNVLPDAPK